MTIGRKHWAIAEGFSPGRSHGPEPAMTSHETACLRWTFAISAVC
jgi:hypothetical protein